MTRQPAALKSLYSGVTDATACSGQHQGFSFVFHLDITSALMGRGQPGGISVP